MILRATASREDYLQLLARKWQIFQELVGELRCGPVGGFGDQVRFTSAGVAPMIPPDTPAPIGETPAGDRTLVRYIRGGDEAAANELYHRYAARLLKVVADRCSPAFAARFDPGSITV